MERILHTDGGSRGNPGPSAIGGVLFDTTHNELASFSDVIENTTNSVAEYVALLKGLELAKQHETTVLHLNMDSEFIIKQLKGEYKVKAEHLLQYFLKAQTLLASFEKVTITHVPRENIYQSRADALVNKALDASLHA